MNSFLNIFGRVFKSYPHFKNFIFYDEFSSQNYFLVDDHIDGRDMFSETVGALEFDFSKWLVVDVTREDRI